MNFILIIIGGVIIPIVSGLIGEYVQNWQGGGFECADSQIMWWLYGYASGLIGGVLVILGLTL